MPHQTPGTSLSAWTGSLDLDFLIPVLLSCSGESVCRDIKFSRMKLAEIEGDDGFSALSLPLLTWAPTDAGL